MTNWKIIESSGRIGGRVHTSYLNGTAPEDYQYQEMGPMRFPVSISDPDTNETVQILDHRMVFQLADALNAMNGNDSSLAVNFIPWIQSSRNTPVSTPARRPDGTVPSRGEVAANPELANNVTATYSNATAVAEAAEAFEEWLGLDGEKMRSIATNVFRAHKQAVQDGNFNFSEAQYLRYVLGVDLNITDQASSTTSNYPSWAYDDVYFSATEWRTIDKGLSRLPYAFTPLVENRTMLNTRVEEMTWDADAERISVHWRSGDLFSMETSSMEFDYTVVSVPFSKVRLWRLPPFTSLLSRSINTLNYQQSCKVALHYATRFWST